MGFDEDEEGFVEDGGPLGLVGGKIGLGGGPLEDSEGGGLVGLAAEEVEELGG